MTPTLISVEEYLATSFEDGDREYIEGELQEINVGEVDHGWLQLEIGHWFRSRRPILGLAAMTEVRVNVGPRRFRVPDISVVRGGKPNTRVIKEPPFLVIEILSPDDRAIRIQEKIEDYLRFGVAHIWVIDPFTTHGEMYIGDRAIRVTDGIYRTENPSIELNINELLAEE